MRASRESVMGGAVVLLLVVVGCSGSSTPSDARLSGTISCQVSGASSGYAVRSSLARPRSASTRNAATAPSQPIELTRRRVRVALRSPGDSVMPGCFSDVGRRCRGK